MRRAAEISIACHTRKFHSRRRIPRSILTSTLQSGTAAAANATLQTEPSPPPPILPTCTLLARNFPAVAAQKFTKRQAGAVLHSTSVTLSSALRGLAAMAHVSNSCRVERVETTADAMDVYFCFAPSARARERDDHRNLVRCNITTDALATPSQLVFAISGRGARRLPKPWQTRISSVAPPQCSTAHRNRTAITLVGAALARCACVELPRGARETTADAMDVYFVSHRATSARTRRPSQLCRYACSPRRTTRPAAALAGYPNRQPRKRAFECRAAAMLHSANRTAIGRRARGRFTRNGSAESEWRAQSQRASPSAPLGSQLLYGSMWVCTYFVNRVYFARVFLRNTLEYRSNKRCTVQQSKEINGYDGRSRYHPQAVAAGSPLRPPLLLLLCRHGRHPPHRQLAARTRPWSARQRSA